MKIKVGIVGGTGYTGVELLRLLVRHPRVELSVITSRGNDGLPVAEMFPSLRGVIDLAFSSPDEKVLSRCDLVFFATPNGTAMTMVKSLLDKGVRVIDLAADFRLKSAEEWMQWYGMAHACPELLAEAVYGLPEKNRQQIASARLVANPGCYPTAVQLGFLPLVEKGLIEPGLIADCKSGVSGAGRKADLGVLLCETSETFKAYAVAGHRHLPEIRQGLNAVAHAPVDLTFVPHLTPMIRGIHATLYATFAAAEAVDVQALYEAYYADEFFVDIMPAGSHPETRSVKGGNVCRIAVHPLPGSRRVVILSVIDNLVKGAAGQAVQNMNLMLGFEEKTGLDQVALLP